MSEIDGRYGSDLPGPVALLDLTYPELGALMREWGLPAFRTNQLWEWIYRKLAEDFEQMTNLPGALRSRLAEATVLYPHRVLEVVTSQDSQTRKSLLELLDGETVECVLMRYEHRRTACISTQVGCPIRCSFCATGKAGLRRNLTAGEIVAQALLVARQARALAPASEHALTNVVYMGMGEPLMNFEAMWRSVEILTDDGGFRLGARRITISTAGVVPGILRLARQPLQVRLAVSLHAPNDRLRDQLVPLNRRYPIEPLMEAVREYVGLTSRRVTFEYALIDGVNDDRRLASELATLIADIPAHVNLIPVNAVQGSPHQPSPQFRVDGFAEVLNARGIPCTVRVRRGIDAGAGCGQLRSRRLSERSDGSGFSSTGGA
jgi:23S rRNA (adenine2503-C2)-methyltransferase